MLLIISLYFLEAQHVLGTTMPIVRSPWLQCWLPHWSFHSWFAVGWLGAVRLEKCPGCRLMHDSCFSLQLWYFFKKNVFKIEILCVLHVTGICCWVLTYCYSYLGNGKIWCMFNIQLFRITKHPTSSPKL